MGVSTNEANELFHAMLRVQKLLLASRSTASRVHDGVDVAAYPVLFVIAGADDARISDIATTLHNDVSTVSRQVSTLVSHGLVAKRPDPNDGRAQVLSLTEEGRAVLRTIQSARAAWFQGLLQEWGPDDAAAFTAQLQRLGDTLDSYLRAHGATPPRMPFDTTKEN
jgi:DNA-binding MarR family transcriptional regulator